jgi:hypothetical protein
VTHDTEHSLTHQLHVSTHARAVRGPVLVEGIRLHAAPTAKGTGGEELFLSFIVLVGHLEGDPVDRVTAPPTPHYFIFYRVL